MKNLILTLLVAGGVLSASPVSTTTTANVELTTPGDPTNVVLGNDYVSPYTMLINGHSYAAMCIDFFDESYLNQPWNAYITPVSGNLSNTYLGNSGATQYKEAAYLYEQMVGLNPNAPGYGSTRTDIQEAVWAITNSAYTPSVDVSKVDNWMTLAAEDYSSMNLSGFEIVSDVNQCPGRNQEFIVATPEPASLMLMGAGLLLAGFGAIRRKLKATA